MDKKLKDLKNDVDTTISPTAYFTEQDRKRIRSKIRAMQTVKTTKRRLSFWPTVLTTAAVSAFIFLMGGMAGKELGLFATGEKPQIEPPQENVPPVIGRDENDKPLEIDTGMLNIHYQDIQGDTVIWSGTNDTPESGSIGYDMVTYNMRTKEFGEIITSDFDFEVYGGQINEDWITWVDAGLYKDTGKWRIYALNRENGKKMSIRESSDVAGYSNPNVMEPRITMSSGANRLAWAEPVAGENRVLIQLYDLDTGILQTVGESDVHAVTMLSDNYLLWTEGEKVFNVYSIEEEKVDATFHNTMVTYTPSLNDTYAVWQEATQTSDSRLVMSAIAGSKEVELFRGAINSFGIGEDYVIWESDQTIYAYSWAYRETTEIGRNGEFPVIRGNTVIWQQVKEGSERTKLQVVELEKPEFDEYQDKMIKKEDLGERHEGLEENLKKWLATNDVFGTSLKSGLYGAYIDNEGTAVIDFVPFMNLIGVPSMEDRSALLNAVTEIILRHSEVNKISYSFNLNRTAFFDWMGSDEQIYTRDVEYQEVPSDQLSLQDSEMAYEMCVNVLTDYYKAVWNGSNINLDTFITNDNLKQYVQKKIQSQHDLHAGFTDSKVKNIEISNWEVTFTDDADGGFLYLKLPADIQKHYGGGYGEVTEFLVRKVNGKLIIVDWYTGGKDTYDFMVRGENETIDNPDIWDDREWVQQVTKKVNEFSGSTK
ncbi:hypothetical protein QWT69_13015 [Sporosarcina oncorhynchi]|uniref:Uncharacterized protein n=1 Tax=Sporosarcina oncorhynchi TaxID=3056444 RepID=A0ABZ0L5C7_9BACL|nr:hypothetical protein [Sporosarcina sp. T2O-4]WOV86786.1 hypothetical protein QWT69_13015 [Sporosarcina sp. T2O-4]